MNRSVAVIDFTKAKDGEGVGSQRFGADEFLTKAACAALTGLLANPIAHQERIRWDDLSSEAWAIAEQMLKNAPVGLLAPRPSRPASEESDNRKATAA